MTGRYERFPIGFWNYVDIGRQDASAVTDWDEAGMTLTMGPRYGPSEDEAAARDHRPRPYRVDWKQADFRRVEPRCDNA